MPLTLFQTDKVKKAMATPASLGIEVLVLLGVAAVIGGIAIMARQASAPMHATVQINLHLWALPKYTALTLARGCAAYVLSLLFTLVYGTFAAHHKRAERIMIPTLDVLQALPVLSFLPGLVLALVGLFPRREFGLELACILTIFTGQVWNMTFSFYGSLRGIPPSLREATAIQRLNGWQVFKILEVPASMIGLVWNSMMSMAGGWFFIATVEAFTLKGRDYRLPGLGSYMSEAIHQGDVWAQVFAVASMILMIVLVDQMVWRPIVVWSERFKLEDIAATDAPRSWVVGLFGKSRLIRWTFRRISRLRKVQADPGAGVAIRPRRRNSFLPVWKVIARPLQWLALLLIIAGALWGCWEMLGLLRQVKFTAEDHGDWLHILLALLASFVRVSAALVIGTIWTVPAGILIGLNPRWAQRLQPVVQVVASYPAPMLFPALIALLVLLHIPFTIGCITLILLGTQWYVLFNVIAGAMAIPSELREAAKVYRLGRWYTWQKLYIPAVFPFLVTGLVTAAGGAWNATIVAEYYQVKETTYDAFGLGSIITKAADSNFPVLAASVITMALFVVLFNRLVWKRLYRLAERRYVVT